MTTTPTALQSFSDRIWRFFVSLKVAVALLSLWLLGSIAGTLIPQNGNPVQYVEMYGTAWSNLFMRLGLFDVYHSTWYTLILLLILLSLLACSLNTLESKIALALREPKRRHVVGTGKKYIHYSIPVPDEDLALADLRRAVKKRFGSVESFEDGRGMHLYAHKQKQAHFMVYLIHAGLVLIILGGMLSALFGFEGIMEIPEGESRDYVFVRAGSDYNRTPIDFSVRCDDFNLERFSSGAPKDYVSDLTVFENGKAATSKRIEVNDPLGYGRFNFYQSSYIEKAPLEIRDPETGKSARALLQPGEKIFLDEIQAAVSLDGFRIHSGMGMTANLSMVKLNGEVFETTVFGDAERNRTLQEGHPLSASFFQNEPVYVTGLQVVSDPGVGLVWLGSFLMMIGFYLTFYTSHRRISITLRDGKVLLAAASQRNPAGYRREIENLLKDAGFQPATPNGEGPA